MGRIASINVTFILVVGVIALSGFGAILGLSTYTVYAQNTSTTIDQFKVGNESQNKVMEQNLTDIITEINFKELNNVTDPSIAISPDNDTIYLSYSKTENNQTNIYLVNSTDGGETFSSPVRVNSIAGDATKNPWTATKIAVGPNNEIYVLWHVIDESNKEFKYGMSSLRLAKSIDDGASFLTTTYPGNDTLTEKAFFDLAVSKNNSVYITYLDSLSNVTDFTISYPSEVKLLRSFDGGSTFESPITIDKTACDCCKTAALTGDNGEVYVLWRHASHVDRQTYSNGTNPYNYEDKLEEGVIYQVIRDIYITHSNDSGKAESFVNATRVHADNWYMNGCPSAGPDLGFDSNGILHVGWFTGGAAMPGTYYANSTDGGKNFSKPLPILVAEWVPTSETNLAVDGKDNVWITTSDSRNENNTNVFLAVKSMEGKLYKNHLFGIGDKPMISSGKNITGIVWSDKDNLELAVLKLR
ncbi:sialidase family protein [Candidatus Nitrosocosmicus hydrocola]|uniref:sialidase family protein n=1 Tax=Candidatus Nitrosocosmicus hydrocola TaxID=1826872 RepID=UPI0011E5BDB2|nr:sialidase family protein [Candidatus Nitrosocosmicus hydrocola]